MALLVRFVNRWMLTSPQITHHATDVLCAVSCCWLISATSIEWRLQSIEQAGTRT